jgi:hypothetical protein
MGMRAGKRGLAGLAALTGVFAAALLLVAVATAPAGNRDPVSAMAADPGLTQVTHGANAAFTASLHNHQKSTFVDIRLEVPVPTTLVNSVPQPAKFKATSCPASSVELLPNAQNPEVFVCHWGTQLRAGDVARVLIVWETPLGGTSENCAAATPSAPEPCITTQGTWFIKEGSQAGSGGPDTFQTNVAGASFLAGTAAATKARGYALDECTNADPASELSTAAGDSLQTTVCPSTTPGPAFPFTPGLIMRIDEGKGQFSKKHPTSFICIPDPTAAGSCPANPGYGNQGYTAWQFSPPATFTFVVDTSRNKVTKVLHDGVDVTTTCTITVDSELELTTVTCDGPVNGGWDFG